MKLKFIMVFLSFALLTGCCNMGCSSCGGGCEVGYWSTTCYTPNSGGASEAAFTDIASGCSGSGCVRTYSTSRCFSSGCGTNW